jgi:hypothetical protein
MQSDTGGYQRLALAVVLAALKDSCDGDDQAYEWLITTGVEWLHLVGVYINPDQIPAPLAPSWAEVKREARAAIKREKAGA